MRLGVIALVFATAFTAGVNEYVEMARADPALLPAEFRELGYEPSRWAPSDLVRIRSHGLAHNLAAEVARERGEDTGALGEHLALLRRAAIDVVTFGTPVRYRFAPAARFRVLHVVNHRGGEPRARYQGRARRTVSARSRSTRDRAAARRARSVSRPPRTR